MYSLDWLHSALDELHALWGVADASQQAALEWAIMDLDYNLSRDPHNEGESRSGNYRVAFSWTLAILFTVDDSRGLAQVHHAWTCRR